MEEAAHNIPGTPGRTFDIEDIFVLAYFSQGIFKPVIFRVWGGK